jgi:hypothetical protein
MNALRFALAAATLFLGLSQVHAAPNVTDLSIFRGRVAGTGTVKLSSGAIYHGKSVIRPSISASGLAAKFKVLSTVKVVGNPVKIDNQFAFTASGKFRGKELAPGDTKGAHTKGKYTATTEKIDFSGKFKVGQTEGVYSGTIQKFANGRLTITYSVFIGENTEPLYIYTYSGK